MARQGALWGGYFRGLIYAAVGAVFLRLFVVDVFRIPNSLMAPSLDRGDYAIAWRLPYSLGLLRWPGTTGLRRGDLIIFTDPEGEVSYVRRIAGLPGESLKNKQGEPMVAEPNRLYVVADRDGDHLYDFGAVESEQVQGKIWAVGLAMQVDASGKVSLNWQRAFQLVR